MYLSLSTVAFLIVGALGLWFWADSLRVRDLANRAAMQACERLQLQFLDGTVAFSNIRLLREDGQVRLRRTYVFDYTAFSVERMQGFVVLTGLRVDSVGFARNHDVARAPTVERVIPVEPDGATSNIAKLEDWRTPRH